MMTIDPLDLNEHAIPDGWALIEGNFLQNTARVAKIHFRLAVQSEHDSMGRKTYQKTLGIIIPETYSNQMAERLARKAALKIRLNKSKL